MKYIQKNDGDLVISLTIDELVTISNALNEICNAFAVPEFQTRIGVSVEEAQGLLKKVGAILDNF